MKAACRHSLLLAALLGANACRQGPTFTRDVAPILFEKCAACHHPGGPGPFSVLQYADAKRRARQIALVTATRYMPPWLPEPGYGEFADERRLSEPEIRAIRSWVEAGAPEGAASELPAVPTFHEGWQLGKPDLVLRTDQPYLLAAEGGDVFRNFLFRAPANARRYVRAVEIIPGNAKIVHHANLLIDRLGVSRRRDDADPEVGFAGMDVELESDVFDPESHFLFWKPGTVPRAEPEDMAWRLDPGTDLVLNCHLQPSGKPEPVAASIGLYFTDRPPSRTPMLVQLENDAALELPPGASAFQVAAELELPLDVEVLAVYPHAHYLGKSVEGFATLPGGERRWLVRIPSWDFRWQAVYRYRRPMSLPRGTVVSMRWTYDNSEANPRNPSRPPRRVRAGDRAIDEMAHLWLQVLPQGNDGRALLHEALARRRLAKDPRDFAAHFNLGSLDESRGRLNEAIDHYRRALEARPADVTALNSLGAALRAAGQSRDALACFREALRSNPAYSPARYNLGKALALAGKLPESAAELREVLRQNPSDADACNELGSVLARMGRVAEATEHLERAIGVSPEHPYAHANLAFLLAAQGKLERAAAEYRAALRINPTDDQAHVELGAVLARGGKSAEAAEHFREALRLNPANAEARRSLERTTGRR